MPPSGWEAVRAKRCLSTPLFYVEEQAMRLDYITKAFVSAAQMQTARADRRLAAAASKLDALSPLKVLSRGYAIGYRTDGRVVKSTADVAPATLWIGASPEAASAAPWTRCAHKGKTHKKGWQPWLPNGLLKKR